MKKTAIWLLLLSLLFCACPVCVAAGDEGNAGPPSLSAIQQSKMDLLKWKAWYHRAAMKAIEQEYMAKSHEDIRYREHLNALEATEREAKGLLLGAPIPKEQPKQEQEQIK